MKSTDLTEANRLIQKSNSLDSRFTELDLNNFNAVCGNTPVVMPNHLRSELKAVIRKALEFQELQIFQRAEQIGLTLMEDK